MIIIKNCRNKYIILVKKMQMINLLVLLLITILFMSISYKIAENFANIDNPYLPYRSSTEYVNKNLLEHSIKCNDAKVQEFIQSALCENSYALNAIKYIEGTTWTKWFVLCNENISDICNRLHVFIKKKLKKTNILYSKVNRFRKNTNDAKEIMIDYDLVYHDNKDVYAYHINIVCVVHLCTKCIRMVYVNLVGSICVDKIYMKSSADAKDMVRVPRKHQHIPDTSYEEESQKCISTQDEQVKNILFDKLKDSYEEHEEYHKNQEYIRNQNIVRNMFLQDLKQDFKLTNKYKKYPYTHDFELCPF